MIPVDDFRAYISKIFTALPASSLADDVCQTKLQTKSKQSNFVNS